MRKIFTLSVLSLITFSCFAQSVNSESYDELMKKSRRARTTSIIMVSTGPVIAVGGIGTLVYGLIENAIAEPGYYYDASGNYTQTPAKKHTTEIILGAAGTVVGLGVALTSIVFSNKASDLKHQARKMKLKPSTDHFSIPGFQNGLANNRATQFKLSLVIPLGK